MLPQNHMYRSFGFGFCPLQVRQLCEHQYQLHYGRVPGILFWIEQEIVRGMGQCCFGNRAGHNGFLDMFFGYFLVFFYANGRMIVTKNMRFPIAVSSFYAVRSGIMLLTKFPFPADMVWHDPGFYSLTVPYDRTRDFFFSGHTGALVLIMLQFSQLAVLNGRKPAGYVWIIIFICLIYIMNMLIVTRVHYTIDVVGGLIFSIYCYWLIGLFTQRLDRIMSAPYKYAIRPLIEKVKQRRMRRRLVFDQNEGTMRNSINDQLINESSSKQQK